MLKWLWSFVGPYRGRVAGALLALIVTSGLTLSLGQGVKILVDQGFAAGSQEGLKDSLQIMLALIIALALGAYFRFFMVSWIGERVVADIRKRLYAHLLTLTPSFFEDNLAGEIQSRVTTDTTLLQTVIGSSLSFALRNVLIFIGGLVLMFISNLKLSLMVIAVVPLIVFPLIFIGRKVKRLSKQSQDEVASVGAWAGESLQNIKVVQAFTRESHVAEQFDRGAEQAFRVALKRIRYRAFLIALVMIMVMGAITAMLYVGGSDVITGELSPGDLSAFVFYAVMVAGSLAAVTEVYGELQRAAGAVERIRELLATQPTIKDTGNEFKLKNHAGSASIELKNISFAYPSRADQWALQDASLTIFPGQSTALVGPSGAGKSTLFDLLLHFREPQKGHIYINNQDISDYPLKRLRDMYALVPQNPVLFSSNVWDNIRFAKPDATDQEVINACKSAHAYDFIMALPEQFESFLGEQGVKLSGGQKQRVAIARAILRDPEILLLDEATSALDAQNEFWVQQALNELMRDRTTLIIAHRLSTVRHVDQIALFDEGKITAVGSHSQLMESSELYKRLAKLQFQSDA